MSNILFLLSHQPNPRFIKQIDFLSTNNDISVLYYHRDSLSDLSYQYKEKCLINESIGNIQNGNYIGRIGNYIKSILTLYKIIKNQHFEKIIVNNIDTLFMYKILTLLSKKQNKIIIEISDLRAHTYKEDLKSIVIRFIEGLIFKTVDKMIITSPKFYDLYYKNIFHKRPFILENKPLNKMIPERLNKIENEKIIIGIVGMLLQEKPYEALFETIKNDKRFEVHIYGKGDYKNLVEKYARKYSNIIYFGEYNLFQDSARIYASLDILYMSYDTTNGSLNNKVALPNKLYEAMYFKVPVITSKDSYLGELVNQYKIGMTFECCNFNELNATLTELSLNIDQYRQNLELIPEDMYLADNDYKSLEIYLNS